MRIISVTENPHLLSRRDLENKRALDKKLFDIWQRIENEERQAAERKANPVYTHKYWDNSIGDFVEV